MDKPLLIKDATIINEGKQFCASVWIEKGLIRHIFTDNDECMEIAFANVIQAKGLLLLPGVIDEHVHFREPGMTHKADIYTESCAAIAGGITSFMDMPNTIPQTTSVATWKQKTELATEKSLANFAFYIGATDNNLNEIKKADPASVCGLKVFLGSSTGNMLVDKKQILEKIFAESPFLVAVHAENEAIIQANKARFMQQLGAEIPISLHPLIRSTEACYRATGEAVDLASKYNTRLHVLHISTKEELDLFSNEPTDKKRITAETCPQYLWFDDSYYSSLGARIKCNPAIKAYSDKESLLHAISGNRIDAIATDHAPHLLSEKNGDCLHAVSGMPSIQFSLPAMLELTRKGVLTIEQVVEKMCHNPARIYHICQRGFIREGYFADLVLIDPNAQTEVVANNIVSKCGWSPFEGETFSFAVLYTIVNGNIIYEKGNFACQTKGQPLIFKNEK